MHFKMVIGGSWGQHGPKSLPKAPPNEAELWCNIRPLLGLGGLLGPLGAQELILSIFDRFLSNFYDFLDDFSMIFR